MFGNISIFIGMGTNSGNYSNSIILGTKESGFIHSLQSSGAIYSIALGCKRGSLPDRCQITGTRPVPYCDGQLYSKNGQYRPGGYNSPWISLQWDDYVRYGQRKSCEFYQLPIEKENNPHAKVQLHNYKLGLSVCTQRMCKKITKDVLIG